MISISDGSEPYVFRRKMGKARPVKEEMDGKVFFYRKSRHLSLCKYYDYCKFPYLYLDIACKQIRFPPRKGINSGNESTVIIIKIVAFKYCTE